MSYCDCDYDMPSVYSITTPRAAKEHKCRECRRTIAAGEHYERVFGIWGGDVDTFKTCSHCIALRDWAKAHVPCVCWAHGHMIDDLSTTIEANWQETRGLKFGYMRRLVELRRIGGRVSYAPDY